MSLKIIEPSGSEECKICEQPAHGVHFGVTTCRACAAFFRRSIIENRIYKCRRADSKCEIVNLHRDSCRYCRLQKCKFFGMTEDNIQRYRDKFSSAQKPRIMETPSFKVKTPAKPLFDTTGMIDEIAQNFEDFRIPENDIYAKKNSLERMDYALQICRKNQKMENLEFTTNIDFVNMLNHWGGGFRRISSWMMHSEEFRNLNSNDKIAIFSSIWMAWLRFERLTMTVKIFGQRTVDEKILVASDHNAIHMGKLKIGISIMSDHESDRILEMFEPLSQKLYDNVAKPLIEIEPTSIEVTYMLCHIFWETAGKKFQGEILLAGEKFLDKIADDLHSYYVKQQKRSNYAGRLARLMTIVRAMQKNHEERQQMFELARLFDVLKVKFSGPIDILQG